MDTKYINQRITFKCKNIKKTQTVKKIEKQKRKLQRSISRSYEGNKEERNTVKLNVIKVEIGMQHKSL